MKFKLNAEDLTNAINTVSVVAPRQVTAQGGAGYLFVVRGERCYVYSRDNTCVARTDFAIRDVEGEGAFVYPAQYTDAFKFLVGECVFESEADEDRFTVRYSADNGAEAERTSFDPQLLSTCDKDLEKATTEYEYPAGLLREAINLARPFLADPKNSRTEEQFKGLMVFDSSKSEWSRGDGTLYSSNGTQNFYFECELFKGKHFEVHGQNLPALLSFLSKSEGTVKFRRGDNFTFLINSKGDVYGWPKQAKTHGKYSYYQLKYDQHELLFSKNVLLNAIQFIRVELDKSRDKVKVSYNHENKQIQLSVADGSSKARSFPVASEEGSTGEEKSREWNVNIDQFQKLVDGVKSNRFPLRLYFMQQGDKEVTMMRTIDTFRMTAEGKVVQEQEGSFECKVTRFMPSKD